MTTKTRLTKTGEPAMGTTIEVHWGKTDDCPGIWEPCKVVGKGWSKGVPRRLILVIVEWEDGERGHLYDFDDVVWRCAHIDGDENPCPRCGHPAPEHYAWSTECAQRDGPEEVLAACHPGCGWNGEVVLDGTRWTCPRCGQEHEWQDHRAAQRDGPGPISGEGCTDG